MNNLYSDGSNSKKRVYNILGKILVEGDLSTLSENEIGVVIDESGLLHLYQTDLNNKIVPIVQSEDTFGFVINDADIVKEVKYVGNPLIRQEFMRWVENSPKPCEVEVNTFTKYNLDKNSIGLTKRVDGTPSANGSEDSAVYTKYHQMVELENINISMAKNDDQIVIMFNLDPICPDGFNRWFGEDTKLFGRYLMKTIANKGYTYKGATGVTGQSAPSLIAASVASETTIVTAWEWIVLRWILVAYLGTVYTDKIYQGIIYGSIDAASTYSVGIMDNILGANGTIPTGENNNVAFKFMYMENIYGLRWKFGANAKCVSNMLYIDKAEELHSAADLSSISIEGWKLVADLTEKTIPQSSGWIKMITALGFPTSLLGSSTTGYGDVLYKIHPPYAYNTCCYLGGTSADGLSCGPFALNVARSVTLSGWFLCGFCSIKSSKVK